MSGRPYQLIAPRTDPQTKREPIAACLRGAIVNLRGTRPGMIRGPRADAGLAWQVEIVSDVCGDLLGDTVVRPALCFVDATVGLFDCRAWMVRGVVICWRDLLPSC